MPQSDDFFPKALKSRKGVNATILIKKKVEEKPKIVKSTIRPNTNVKISRIDTTPLVFKQEIGSSLEEIKLMKKDSFFRQYPK